MYYCTTWAFLFNNVLVKFLHFHREFPSYILQLYSIPLYGYIANHLTNFLFATHLDCSQYFAISNDTLLNNFIYISSCPVCLQY